MNKLITSTACFLYSGVALASPPCLVPGRHAIVNQAVVQHHAVQQVVVQEAVVAPLVVRVPVQDYLNTGNLTHYYSAGYTQQLLENQKTSSIAEDVVRILIERGIVKATVPQSPVPPAPTPEGAVPPGTAEPSVSTPSDRNPSQLDVSVADHISKNCIVCHNSNKKQGDFSVENLNVSNAPVELKLEIFRRVSGLGLPSTEQRMPPNKTLPNNVESDFLKWAVQKN